MSKRTTASQRKTGKERIDKKVFVGRLPLKLKLLVSTKKGIKMKTVDEIKSILKKRKKELREKYHVKQIGIFGSYIRKQQKKRSDIDILVEFEVVPGLLKFIELEEYLSKLLDTRVDMVRKEAIREELKERILAEVLLL